MPQEENRPDPDEVYQPFWPQYSGYATFTAGSEQLGCAIDFFPLHVREKGTVIDKTRFRQLVWIFLATLDQNPWEYAMNTPPNLNRLLSVRIRKGVFSSKSLSHQSFLAFFFAYDLLLVKYKQNNIEVQNA